MAVRVAAASSQELGCSQREQASKRATKVQATEEKKYLFIYFY